MDRVFKVPGVVYTMLVHASVEVEQRHFDVKCKVNGSAQDVVISDYSNIFELCHYM